MVKFLIKRPIAVLMSSLAIVVLGILASTYIPISLMPDIEIPEIAVQVNAPGQNARKIENNIVAQLRGQLLQLAHVDNVESETSNGLGIIRLSFVHGTNMQYAFIEVNEKIDRAMGRLPKEVERPRVIKANATDLPVLYLNVSLKNGNSQNAKGKLTQAYIDFNSFVERIVKKRIEQISEVAMVDISGIVKSEILLIPDQEKMIALGVNLGDLENAILRQDINIGNVSVNDNQYRYNLRFDTNIIDLSDIKDIYINKNNKIFQLKEIANITERPQTRQGSILHKGEEAVTMAIIKQSDARIGDLKNEVNTTLGYMRSEYPDLQFSVDRDQTRLLEYSIDNMSQSLLYGMLLAFLVMFVFLKDIRSSILIGISVPVSIVISLLIFYLLDISINIISLSGLVLGTGLMIDNSIIVIDNINQYRQRGYSLIAACVTGTNEIFRPLLSSALTTCAVFIPLIFISGMIGALFYDQAMAITIGLLVSLLVSVMLLPVLFHAFQKNNTGKGRITQYLKKTKRINYVGAYEKGFKTVMRHQRYVFSGFVILFGLTVLLYFILPKDRMPELTTSETILSIDWNAPINAKENKERVLKLMQQSGNGLDTYNAFVGQQQFLLNRSTEAKTSETTVYIKANNILSLSAIKEKILVYINKHYPDALFEYEEVDTIFSLIFSDDDSPLVAHLIHIGPQSELRNKELDQMNKNLYTVGVPGMISSQNIAWNEQFVLQADKQKMMLYNVSERAMVNTLQSAFNAKNIMSIADNQVLIPVVIGSESKTLNEVLRTTLIQASDSTYHPLKTFIHESKSKELKTIAGGKAGEYYPIHLEVPSGEEINTIEKVRQVVKQNANFDVFFSGSFFQNQKLVRELSLILTVTLVLLYFILASQFESLSLPLIILLEIPLAISGAFLFLLLFDMSINLMSMIGIVVMCGIVINDSILKIDTIIQLQKSGYSTLRALLIAGQRRLKPILMTSLTTILALLPILFLGGLGSELQAPLAIALIGGMIMGTFVSLYFIPLCYFHLIREKITS